MAPLPLENTHLKFLHPVNVTLFEKQTNKKGLWECDYVKDFERSTSLWIIPIGPECHHNCPYKREKRAILDRRGEETLTQRIRQSEDKDRDWSDITTHQESWGTHQELEQTRNWFFSIAPRETVVLLRFWSCSVQNCEKINFCYFKLVVTCCSSCRELIYCTIKKQFSKV